MKGRKITGFTTQAEHDMKIMEALRSWGEPLVDEHAEALGAECKFGEWGVGRGDDADGV